MRRHRQSRLELSRARGFNLDELILPPDHEGSFQAFMERHAWRPGLLDRDRCAIPSLAGDPQAACHRYDRALERAGGLDLAILGVGADGHVAFNLPGPPRSGTHVVELPASVAEALALPEAYRPLRAITIGLDLLLGARRLLLMATGAAKARAVRAIVEGPENARWPCSLLRAHPCFDVIVDRAAGCAPP